MLATILKSKRATEVTFAKVRSLKREQIDLHSETG